MAFPTNIILILAELWLLSALVLALHRLSARFGLAPLLACMGGFTVLMQSRTLGWLWIDLFSTELFHFSVRFDTHLILALLLMGLLVIYIVNGTTQARVSLLGMLVITLLMISLQLLLGFFAGLPGVRPYGEAPRPYAPIILVGSLVAFILDMVVLVVVYQAFSNLRGQFPSRLASGVALLSALWTDALIISLAVYLNNPSQPAPLINQLAGKTAAGLVLWPVLYVYLWRVVPDIPRTAASIRRPAFDIFISTQELENRARFQYDLLRTLGQINQLVIRSNDPQTLLEQACMLLSETRSYHLVWVGVCEDGEKTCRPAAYAGGDFRALDPAFISSTQSAPDPAHAALQSGKHVLIKDLNRLPDEGKWRKAALEQGYRCITAHPMRLGDRILGVLNIYSRLANAFSEDEIELIQELADDLAYALVSLDARCQQAILNTAVQNMQDGLTVMDVQGKIIYVNPTSIQLFNKPAKELLGANIVNIAPWQEPEKVVKKYIQTIIEQEQFLAEFDVKASDGQDISLSARASLVRNMLDQPAYIVLSMDDITRRKQYEHRLLTLNQVFSELAQIRDLDKLFDSFLKATEELLRADASGIYLVSQEDQKVQRAVTHNLPKEYRAQISTNYQGMPGETALSTGQYVSVEDVLASAAYGERITFMAEFGLRALLVLPLLQSGHILGALVAYYHAPHSFSEEEIQLGLTLSSTVAITIQNAYLYEAEHSQRSLAEALAQAATTLNSSLDLDEVLDQILEQTLRNISCKLANIVLIDGDTAYSARRRGDDLHSDHQQEMEHIRFPLSMPTYHYMLSTGRPLLIQDTLNDPLWNKVEGTDWIRSYAGVPMLAGEQIIGFLDVESSEPNFFTPEVLGRLQTFAVHSAIAIQNARLYEETRKQAEELAALVSAAAAVSTSLEIGEVTQIVAQQVLWLLNAGKVLIYSYDPETNAITLLSHLPQTAWEGDASLTQTLDISRLPAIQRAISHSMPVQLHYGDAEISPAELQFMENSGARSLLALPLVAQEQTIGVIELTSADSARVFSSREIALAQTMSFQAVSAIQNARLYQRTQQYAVELEDRVQERTAELKAAKERIEGILASVPDAVFVLDSQHELVHANQAGEVLLSAASEQGLDLFKVDVLAHLVEGGAPSEKTILDVQGRSYQPLASHLSYDHRPAGQVLVFRDVTRFRELDKMKTKFVSDVSHELRTPLTNMTIYLDLLAYAKDPAKQQGYLVTLQRETGRLTNLIDDLLTISRLEAGRVEVFIKQVDINRLVGELVSDRAIMAASKGLQLTFQPVETSLIALVDPRLLNQAISNLLTNAINYTPKNGHICLHTASECQDSHSWIKIDIRDDGIGIALEETGRIFERFYRGVASYKSNAPGTGLGLAISKEIVERMGGRLTLASQPGRGSTFTIWLPGNPEK